MINEGRCARTVRNARGGEREENRKKTLLAKKHGPQAGQHEAHEERRENRGRSTTTEEESPLESPDSCKGGGRGVARHWDNLLGNGIRNTHQNASRSLSAHTKVILTMTGREKIAKSWRSLTTG